MLRRSYVYLISIALLLGGCGAGQLGAQADIVTITGITTNALDRLLHTLRAAALEQILTEASQECTEQTPCPEDRQTHYRDRYNSTQADWDAALACEKLVPEALHGWVDALETARMASDERLAMGHLVARAARLVEVYDAAAVCINEALPEDSGFEMPRLPEAVRQYAEGMTDG